MATEWFVERKVAEPDTQADDPAITRELSDRSEAVARAGDIDGAGPIDRVGRRERSKTVT